MEHEVGTQGERSADGRRGEGRVDDEQRAAPVRGLGEAGDVRHTQGRVRDRLAPHQAGGGGHRGGRLSRRVDQGHPDAPARQQPGEHVVRAAVQAALRDDMVARGEEGEQRGRDRGHPRGERLPGLRALQRGDGRGEGVAGRVVDPAVDVAEGVVRHDGGELRGRLEREGRRPVHGRHGRTARAPPHGRSRDRGRGGRADGHGPVPVRGGGRTVDGRGWFGQGHRWILRSGLGHRTGVPDDPPPSHPCRDSTESAGCRPIPATGPRPTRCATARAWGCPAAGIILR